MTHLTHSFSNEVLWKWNSEKTKHGFYVTIQAMLCLSPSLNTNMPETNEPPHDKTNIMACASSEDSNQPGHPPSLISVFAVRMKKAWVLSYPLSAQRRRWSGWADAQADLSLRWAQNHFVGFVMRRLKYANSSRQINFQIPETLMCLKMLHGALFTLTNDTVNYISKYNMVKLL